MTYKEFDEKVQGFEIYRKKRISVEVIVNTLGAILTAIGILSLCYGVMINFYEQVKQASSLDIPIIYDLWNFLVSKGALLTFLPQLVSPFVVGIVLSILIPVFVSGIYALIVYNVPTRINADDKDTSIKELKELSKRLKDASRYVFIPDFIAVLINIIILLMSFLVWFHIFSFTSKHDTTLASVSVAIAALFPTAIFFLPCWIFKKLSISISSFLWKNTKTTQINALSKEINTAISKLEKEKREKDAELKREREIEETRKKQEKLEKDLLEGQKMYEEAMASEPVNEKLIKKAAKLGHPGACYYLGKNLLSDWLSGLYTAEEKEKIAEDAAKYFDVARQIAVLGEMNIKTECQFLWLFCRLQYESNTKAEWQKMLSDLRDVQKAGDLPEEYTETLELAMKTVINSINKLDTQPSSQPVYYEEPAKKLYCQFRNGAICTKQSNSVMIYHCNYVNNPSACSTARDNKALEYR